MSFRTALKESVKSAKTTGNFGSKNFAVFVYVLSVSLVCLQVNVHVHLSGMFTTAFYVVTEK